MKIKILTLFPEMFEGFLTNSIIKRAIAKKIVKIKIIDIRKFTKDKYGRVDSAPVGGGAGLIMKCQPILDCLKKNSNKNSYKILLTPRGKQYNQKIAKNLAKTEDLVVICGHYEGIDERVNKYVDDFISIGDYVLTGGEIASMAIADSIVRLLDGAIAKESTIEESFNNGLLEYPQYTEPFNYNGDKVPDILYSGNHEAIRKWRQKQALKITKEKRPDLYKKYPLTKEDIKLNKELESNETPSWESKAIEKGHKFKH